MGEINVYGIYIPILLVQAIIAYVLFKLMSPLIDRLVMRGWLLITVAFISLVMSGLLAGFVPAYRASKIKPIEALRAE
jgi:ABC-type lipoprotein release transport system permease subunit